MKKIIFTILAVGAIGFFVSAANAQMTGARPPDRQGFSNSSADWDKVVEHTLREEKEGKELWDKFQAKEVACADFNNGQYGVLGEYFMGRMAGDSHAAMNAMMIQAHGEDGEEQIHIVMGKRLSGCDTSASINGIGAGWIPMMNNMMNFGFGPFGGFGWIFMVLWWILIIAGIIALIKWFTNQSRGTHGHEKSPLEILKERYAKGEIDNKEFEKRKKDLS